MQDQLSLEERASYLRALIEHAPDPLRKEFSRRMEISWLYHDNALEGLVLSPDEIGAAIDGQVPEEPSLANLFDEIRQHKAAIERVREWAKAKGAALDIDFLRELYAILAPEEVEGKKPPPFRKEALIQRLYFHEIESPEKIPARLKAFFQWVNSEETRRSTHVVRLAAKAHFQLLHIFPFPRHNGRIARLIMNAFLLDAGFPPAVIHSTERQRYYESLRLSDNALAQLVKEALSTSIESSIRFLESRMPGALVSKVQSIAHRKSAPTDEAIFEKDSEAEEADAVDASRTSGCKKKSLKAIIKTTKAAK
ncbi:MAG: Fic family protein, partial [Deltaproteobacteria bacterium]|nr:Fic family protein [Deltaproteobacteria bacterium]